MNSSTPFRNVSDVIRTHDLPLRSLPGTMLRSDRKYQKIRSRADFFTCSKSISYHPVMADISMFFIVSFASLLAGR